MFLTKKNLKIYKNENSIFELKGMVAKSSDRPTLLEDTEQLRRSTKKPKRSHDEELMPDEMECQEVEESRLSISPVKKTWS